MENPSAESILSAALTTIAPASRMKYTGKAETYFTFQLIGSRFVPYADDLFQGEHLFRIELFSKKNYTALLKRAKEKLRDAGFYEIVVDAEQYDNDTGYYRIQLFAKFLEEGAASDGD